MSQPLSVQRWGVEGDGAWSGAPNNGLQGMETRVYFREILQLQRIAFPPLKLGR
jgi:hypothetical protein